MNSLPTKPGMQFILSVLITYLLLLNIINQTNQTKQDGGDLHSESSSIDSSDDYADSLQLKSRPTLPRENSFYDANQLPEKEYLVHSIAEAACKLNRGCQRRDRLNNTYLNFCTKYKLENLLSNDILMSIMHDSTEKCNTILDEFIQLDETIEYYDRLFKKLLTRYNCYNGYSVKWSCEDCKRSYKDWLCAINLPYYMNGEQIKPCISFCERVEQRCPYLHPIARGQYGGQPVFICKDPNIPFVPEITPDIPYSEPFKCYDLCHLTKNLTELVTDSLSKYDYDKCPDKKLIAAEVHKDPLYCSPGNDSKGYDFSDYTAPDDDEEEDENSIRSNVGTKMHRKPKTNEHLRKLNELRHVLAIYRSQPKSHPLSNHPQQGSH